MTAQLTADRLACTGKHLPSTYNPWHDKTWCICGAVQWPGERGVWKSVPRYAPTKPRFIARAVGTGAVGLGDDREVIGWENYFLDVIA